MSAIAATVFEGRNALRAVNEADVLREVLTREIRALGTMWAVGKRRPITELPPEKQEQVRAAYADTLWASDYCVEMMGICTSEALAQQAVERGGKHWFKVKLPIDTFLSEEVVQGEWAVKFPLSDTADLYENLQAAVVSVPIAQLRAMEDEIQRLQQQLTDIREALNPSP